MKERPDPVGNEFFSDSLPTRITGIVFWGTLLVGFLIAIIMLYGREDELTERRITNDKLLEREVKDFLEQHATLPILKSNNALLSQAVQSFQSRLGFEAIELSTQDDTFQAGERRPNQEPMISVIQIHSPQWPKPVAVRMTAYFPDLQETLSSYRKHILMAIGALVVVYALILQQIFHRLLSLPFFNMVTAAKRFADGNPESRFDESYDNEFGFLSKFINRALDSIAEQQKDLNDALMRVTRSEAELFREKERAEVTLQSIAEAVITTNEVGDVQYLNPIAERITGWTNQEAHGLPLSSVITLAQENSGSLLVNPVYECLKTNKVEKLSTHAALVRRDGETVAIEASAAPMRNDKGEVIGAVMACQDVSQARKLAYQLSYQAGHDSLTGLYNRREFDTKLCELLENSKLSNNQHVLLYLDLDQFKVVNDTCGHAAGDKLLLQLSMLLSHKVRKNDILARLGGDEFAILLVSCDIDYGRKIAESLLNLISDFRFVWGEKIFQIGVSIGLVPVTAASESAAEVMSAADAACYVAKDEGRNRIQMYTGEEGHSKKYGEMQWVPRIHKAIEEDRLILCRQNIAALSGEDGLEHAEILLRLQCEDGSIVPPMAFIPAAERYNIMPLIDRWVFKRALEWLKAHPTAVSGRPQCLSINISGQSLGEELFLEFILDQLTQSGVPAERICLEITETAAIANIGFAMEFINVLKKKGCAFALDDFGSGMSSYSYLKNLDVDFLKIDGSFVRDMAADPVDLAMVESIHRIGHVMGIRTIAEFVEDSIALDKLRSIGVDFAQGHIVHKPEPLWEVATSTQQEILLQRRG